MSDGVLNNRRMHTRLAKHEKAQGGSSPEFLRTHPGAERRIKVSCSVSTFSPGLLIFALASRRTSPRGLLDTS